MWWFGESGYFCGPAWVGGQQHLNHDQIRVRCSVTKWWLLELGSGALRHTAINDSDQQKYLKCSKNTRSDQQDRAPNLLGVFSLSRSRLPCIIGSPIHTLYRRGHGACSAVPKDLVVRVGPMWMWFVRVGTTCRMAAWRVENWRMETPATAKERIVQAQGWLWTTDCGGRGWAPRDSLRVKNTKRKPLCPPLGPDSLGGGWPACFGFLPCVMG